MKLSCITNHRALWLPQWAVRRWYPQLWEKLADAPFTKQNKLGPWLRKARKVWQAIPSAAAGAAIMALTSGGDLKVAVLGAVGGLAVPIWHELLKRLPIPYGAKSVEVHDTDPNDLRP